MIGIDVQLRLTIFYNHSRLYCCSITFKRKMCTHNMYNINLECATSNEKSMLLSIRVSRKNVRAILRTLNIGICYSSKLRNGKPRCNDDHDSRKGTDYEIPGQSIHSGDSPPLQSTPPTKSRVSCILLLGKIHN